MVEGFCRAPPEPSHSAFCTVALHRPRQSKLLTHSRWSQTSQNSVAFTSMLFTASSTIYYDYDWLARKAK